RLLLRPQAGGHQQKRYSKQWGTMHNGYSAEPDGPSSIPVGCSRQQLRWQAPIRKVKKLGPRNPTQRSRSPSNSKEELLPLTTPLRCTYPHALFSADQFASFIRAHIEPGAAVAPSVAQKKQVHPGAAAQP